MDVRHYFRKIREVEAALGNEEYPLVISPETSDGGKPGVVSEVNRLNAARMIVEGSAVLATDEQREAFRQQQIGSKVAAERAEMARRVQVAIINDQALSSQVLTRKTSTSIGQVK